MIVLEDPNAGLSKYEIKMKARNKEDQTKQKWAQVRGTSVLPIHSPTQT